MTSVTVKDLNDKNPMKCRISLKNIAINGSRDDSVIEKIKLLKTSKASDWGCPISWCAIAALDVLGIEKYYGSEEGIINLIKTKFYSQHDAIYWPE